MNNIIPKNAKGETHGYLHRYFENSLCNDKTLERSLVKHGEEIGYYEWHNHTSNSTKRETCYFIR